MNKEHAIATLESKDDAAIIAEITGAVSLWRRIMYTRSIKAGKLYQA